MSQPYPSPLEHRFTYIDPEIHHAIEAEFGRQQNQIELIASENIVSEAVLEAQGSILTNKYAEGYPQKRYYGGCEYVDRVETLAIERGCQLFGCRFANVQPHSGSQANQAVFFSLLKPGDTVLGMSLPDGGHLTHGATFNISGKYFKSVMYGVRQEDHRIDMEHVAKLAREHRPRLIIAGGSAYSRAIDFAHFRRIADEVEAYLLADIAHYAGLICAGFYPSPFPHAHIATTTTHKTLRGPRGGMILTDEADLAKKINSAVFPGLQGGPLMHVIAAKAIAFFEALQPSFHQYAKNIVDNAQALTKALLEQGLSIVSGGTDSHLVLVDIRPKGLTGKTAQEILEEVGITCNKNAIPFDPQKPALTSGIRLGTPAVTTRGFGITECEEVAAMIGEMLDTHTVSENAQQEKKNQIRSRVKVLCDRFPIYRR